MKDINNALFQIRKIPPYFWLSLFFLSMLFIAGRVANAPLRSFWKSFAHIDLVITIYLFLIVYLIRHYFFYIRPKGSWWHRQPVRSFFNFDLTVLFDFFIRIIPFIIFIYIYYAMHDVASALVGHNSLDSWLISIDRFIFNGRDPVLVWQKFVNPYLTSFFAFAYSSYLLYFIIPPIVFFFRGKKYLDIALMSAMITAYLGLMGYFLVPCAGPVVAQKNLFSCQLITTAGENYSQDSMIARYLIINNAFHCFPSLHFANTLVWLYLSWKYLRQVKWFKYFYYLLLPWTILIWLSTLYLRWHYLTDIFGGLLVAVIGIYFGPKIINYWERLLKKFKVSLI